MGKRGYFQFYFCFRLFGWLPDTFVNVSNSTIVFFWLFSFWWFELLLLLLLLLLLSLRLVLLLLFLVAPLLLLVISSVAWRVDDDGFIVFIFFPRIYDDADDRDEFVIDAANVVDINSNIMMSIYIVIRFIWLPFVDIVNLYLLIYFSYVIMKTWNLVV